MTDCFSHGMVCAATALFNRPWSGLHAEPTALAAGFYMSYFTTPAASAVGSQIVLLHCRESCRRRLVVRKRKRAKLVSRPLVHLPKASVN